MKLGIVFPDFLFTFGFTIRKHTCNISISEIAISNLFRKSKVDYSSNHQCVIRVSYDIILFNCSKAFGPKLRHCYCKARRML